MYYLKYFGYFFRLPAPLMAHIEALREVNETDDPRETERQAIIQGIYGIMRMLTESIASGVL